MEFKTEPTFRSLGLTGKIISVVPRLRKTIEISRNGKVDALAHPANSPLYDALDYLSHAPQWNHTVIGWTGEILLTRDPEPSRLQNRSNILSDLRGADSDAQSQTNNSMKHSLKDVKASQCTSTTQEHIGIVLEAVYNDCEVIPVWLGENSTATDGMFMLGDQDRWTRFTNAMVWSENTQSSNTVDTTVAGWTEKDKNDHKTMIEEYLDVILKAYEPGDILWIHDYQLMPLVGELRAKLPQALIAYFHHTNWLTHDCFEMFPEWDAHVTGILGASIIGVQHEDTKDQILKLCDQITTIDASDDTKAEVVSDKIVVAPTIINFATVSEAIRQEEQVNDGMLELKTISDGKKIIAVRARLDDAESVLDTLKGFTHYLDKHPESRDKVVLTLTAKAKEIRPATNMKDEQHAEYSDSHGGHGPVPEIIVSKAAEALVDGWVGHFIERINSDLGTEECSSIIHKPQYISPAQYSAMLKSADLGLITADDSDINTTAEEFLASQKDKHSPLVVPNLSHAGKRLSENGGAIPVNMSEPESVSNSIFQGLNMSDDEKLERHQKLSKQINHISVARWTNTFLTEACKRFVLDASRLDMKKLGNAYTKSSKRLLVFDYDGTLSPLVDDPEAAIPTKSVMDSLIRLSSDVHTAFWLVSGRSRVFLEKHFGHIETIGLSAEHGCFMKRPGTKEWVSLAESIDMGWHTVAGKVFDQLAKENPGSEVERKEVAIVWHYRNADHVNGLRVAKQKQIELEELLKGWDVDVGLGSNILEVKPKSLNKGIIMSRLVDETFDSEKGFVFCAGDDTTDEGKSISVRIRTRI